MKTVVALMNTQQGARSAIEDLVNSGFRREAIQIMGNEGQRQEFSKEGGGYTGAAEESGARYGFLSGGTAPLTGLGVVEKDAEYYAEGVNRGGFVVTVSCDDDKANMAADILRRHGSVDIDERAQAWRQEGWRPLSEREGVSGREREGISGRETFLGREGSREGEEVPSAAAGKREGVIPVVEEKMEVGKRQVETGGVKAFSRIVETPVEEEVRLREEHATIERRPVDRPATEAERDAFKERSFEVRETAEEPVISKQARVKEEVAVGKEGSERTEVVRDTLRRTEVEVEKMGAGQGKDVSAMDDDEFERHFRATYAGRGERFDESYRSAYHFAEAESRSHPQFQNKDWSEVEEDIHRDWERTHPGTWNRVEEAIHFGWNRTRRH